MIDQFSKSSVLIFCIHLQMKTWTCSCTGTSSSAQRLYSTCFSSSLLAITWNKVVPTFSSAFPRNKLLILSLLSSGLNTWTCELSSSYYRWFNLRSSVYVCKKKYESLLEVNFQISYRIKNPWIFWTVIFYYFADSYQYINPNSEIGTSYFC